MSETIKVHDDGFVRLVDWMPRENLDDSTGRSCELF